MKVENMLVKHRNLFLVVLLVTTLVVGSMPQRDQASSVNIPVIAVSSQELSPLETYRQKRDSDALADIAALDKLIAQTTLDTQTRDAAAEQLQIIIDTRQAQTALEGALVNSSLAPCVAVISGDAITIVTNNSTITEKDSALVLTLVTAHTNIRPENIRIITAE